MKFLSTVSVGNYNIRPHPSPLMRGQKNRGRNLLWVLAFTIVSSSGGLSDIGHCKRNRNLKENYKWALLNYTKLRAEK
jgi:hypothetical protein